MKVLRFFVLLFLSALIVHSCKTSSKTNSSDDKSAQSQFANAMNSVNGNNYSERAKRIAARDSLARQSLGEKRASAVEVKSTDGALVREMSNGSPLYSLASQPENADGAPKLSLSNQQLIAKSIVLKPQDYRNDMKNVLVGKIEGSPLAKSIAIAFKQLSTETYFDHVLLVDKSGQVCDIYSGNFPEGLVSAFCPGNSIEIRLATDAKISGFEGSGFEVMGYYQNLENNLGLASSDNAPPVAVAQANPPRQWEGASIKFTGSNSYPSSGLKYFWTFGDGSTSTSANPTYSYKTQGTYTVRLVVRDSSNNSSSDQISVFIDRLEPPTNFGIISVSARRALLGWNEVSGADGYRINNVQGYTTPSCTGGNLGQVSQYQLTDLLPQTNYSVAICAYNSVKTSDSRILHFKTNPVTPPPVPKNVTVSNIKSTTFTLNWSSGNGNTTGFAVAISQGVLPPTCAKAVNAGQQTSYRYQNLAPGQTYAAMVCALNIDGDSTASGTVTVTMGPPEPSALAIQGTSPSSLDLSWVSGGLNTNSFILAIAPGTTAPPAGCANGYNVGNVTKYSLGALDDDSLYSIRVCAVGSGVTTDGISSSGRTWVLDPRNLPPRDTQTNFPIESTIVDTYRYIFAVGTNGKIYSTSFNLAYPASRWAPWSLLPGQADYTNRAMSTSFNGGSVTITAYVPKYNDYFTISGNCSAGSCKWGSWSKTPAAQAPQPSDPSNLSVANIQGTTATITWVKAPQSAGNIGYTVVTAPGLLAPDTCANGTAVGDVATKNLTGLTPASSYAARICASNARGALSPGQVITFATAQMARPPEISGLTATVTSSTSAKLTWTGGGGSTNGYLVARAVGKVPPVNCLGATSSVTTAAYTFNDLKPGTNYSFRVCSRAANTAMSLGLTQTVATTKAVARINAAGGAVDIFSADNRFSGGATYGVKTTIDTSGTTNAAPMAVYQTVRYGDFLYNLTGLEAARPYQIRLHFSEIYYSKANDRLFDVYINQNKVIASLDVFTEAGGSFKSLAKGFKVFPDSTGKIQIITKGVKNTAVIAGVEVIAFQGSQFEVGTPNLNSAQPFAEFTANATDAVYEFGTSQMDSVRAWIGFSNLATTQSFKFNDLAPGAIYALRIFPASTSIAIFAAEVSDAAMGVITEGQAFRPLVAGALTEALPWTIKFKAQAPSVTIKLKGLSTSGHDFMYFDYMDTFFP